jgi:hypothetical protein
MTHIPIKGYSTFDPLKHCIVGRGHTPSAVRRRFGNSRWTERLVQIMEETEEDLTALSRTLNDLGVQCYRPEAQFEIRPRSSPIAPRDHFCVVGEKLLVGKTVPGFNHIIKKINPGSIKMYLDVDVSSANMIRCGDHIHWDIHPSISKHNEEKILEWLNSQGYRTTVTRMGWHMDGVYSIVKPGVIVASREFPELESIYPNWDILRLLPVPCDVDVELQSTIGVRNKDAHNYDVNILGVDTQTCILTAVNKELQLFLERHSIDPIVVNFRHRAFWDNGIHCLTQDLYREGSLETYV